MSVTDRTSGKPYSAKAYDAACSADVSGWSPMYVLNAAHDREALGLDASARIGDTLNEVVARLREYGQGPHSDQESADWVYPHEYLLREFGASRDR
jgi:hypothetical protein